MRTITGLALLASAVAASTMASCIDHDPAALPTGSQYSVGGLTLPIHSIRYSRTSQ
jgi:hypothetical protein